MEDAKQPASSTLRLHPRANRVRRAQFLVAVGIAALVFFNALRLRGPRCLPIDAPPAVPSGARAQQIIAETIGTPPQLHPTGSAENIAVRDQLIARLEGLGFEVELDQGPVDELEVSNIIALRRGTTSRLRPLMLSSHYDSSFFAPGAGDAGVAYSAILEAVRALQHAPPLRRDLYVVLTDAEEQGLKGAQRLVDVSHPILARDPIAFNFDARGSQGACLMFETCAGDLPVVRTAAPCLPRPVFTSSMFVYVYKRLPRGTDFTHWQRAGLTGLNFALVGGAWNHHQPTDILENVSPRTSQHYADTAYAIVRQFDELSDTGWLADAERPSGVFCDILSVAVFSLSHFQMQAVSLVGIALALLAVLRTARPREVAITVAVFAALIIAFAVLGAAMGLMFRSTPLAEHRFTPVGSYVAIAYAVATLAFVIAVGTELSRFVAPRASLSTLFLIWAVIACGLAFTAPGLSYLLGIPALVGAGLLAAFPASMTARATSLLVVAVFMVPVLMLLQQVIGPGAGTIYCLAVGAAAMPLFGVCHPRGTGNPTR